MGPPGQLVVPAGAPLLGKYQITGNVQIAGTDSTTGVRGLFIVLNAATIIAAQVVTAAGVPTVTLEVSTLYQLNPGDFVRLAVQQNSGALCNVNPVEQFSPEFMIALVA